MGILNDTVTNFMEKSLLGQVYKAGGRVINAFGGKGGGRVENPADVRKYEEQVYSQQYKRDGTLADDSPASLLQIWNNMPYSTQSDEEALEDSIRPRLINDGRIGYRNSAAHKNEMLRRGQ